MINILLENLIKYRDEIRNTHSNHDIGNTRLEKNIKTAKSVETKEREITSGEQLNMILNDGNYLNNTPSHKSNHAETGKNSSDRKNGANHTSQSEGDTNNRKRTLIIGDSIVENIEGWRLNERIKSTVHVKSFSGATTKGMKHHVRGCLEDNPPDTAIIRSGTNNLKNNESAEDIATDIMNLAMSVKNEEKTVVVSGITVRNDKFNDKVKNVNHLRKRRCEVEKIFFVDNSNITVSMLNHSGLHLNERGTTRLVNTLCSSLAK